MADEVATDVFVQNSDVSEKNEINKQTMEEMRTIRKAKLSQLTRRMNIIKELMNDTTCVGEVKSNEAMYKTKLDEFKQAHAQYQCMLNETDRESDTKTWFEPKWAVITEFLSSLSQWWSSLKTTEDSTHVHDQLAAVTDDIRPEDSASAVRSQRSQTSKRQSRSLLSSQTTSSVRIQAEAERATLLVKAAALKEKHALEEKEEQLNHEKEQIRKKKELLDIHTELAATLAKISVLKSAEDDENDPNSTNVDGMNEYFDSHIDKDDTLDFKDIVMTPSVKPKAGTTWHHSTVHMPAHTEVSMPQPQHTTVVQQTTTTTRPSRQTVLISEAPKIPPPPTTARVQQTQSASRGRVEEPDQLHTILQSQNNITKSLVRQQQIASLPKRDIVTFDGDILQYQSFIRSFEQIIESKVESSEERLSFLEQYTKGPAQVLVKSCLHLPSDRSFQTAKHLLKENYGNEYRIANAYIEKALSWAPIKAEDPKALQAYTLFLRSCCNSMESMMYMDELNLASNLKAIMFKLPHKIRDRWRSVASNMQTENNTRVTFHNLVEFLEKQVRIYSDPVFGNILDGSQSKDKSKFPLKTKSTGNFATRIDHVAQTVNCEFCKGKHALSQCSSLRTKSNKDKIDFLRKNGICFGCLAKGHLSKDCKRRLICDICKKPHPRLLHVEYQQMTSKDAEKPPMDSDCGKPITPKSCGHIGAGKNDCALSIIPVQVKNGKSDQIIKTYAFLDSGSSATFCTEELMSKLHIKGRKTSIMLRTLSQEKRIPSCLVTGLEVAGLESSDFVALPVVYTQQEMPVTKDNIIRKEDLSQWPYLQKVNLPFIDAKVELLIGSNAHKVMEPWEVINSEQGGPFAIRTHLGWVINGPLRGYDPGVINCPAVTCNRISIARIEELLISQYNQDFSERAFEDKPEMSVEDKKFMKCANSSVMLQDGHYILNLPFRSENPVLPNNRPVAEQRLLGLKKKFQRNEQFKKEYANFVSDIIDSKYAEVIPHEELKKTDGRVWYLPHHGVYHPKKKTLRVVFDCSASYQGTSLNSELLQGPDLTNSLVGVLVRFRLEPVAVMADIRSMFHQVRVSPKDVDFLRFLWWPEGDVNQSAVEHRMLVHLFGAVSSPSCASFALKRTAEDNKGNFSSEVISAIKNNFYVDDCLKSLPSDLEALQFVKDLSTACQTGGFQLTKWASNSRTVLSSIPLEERAKDVKMLDLEKDELPVERALGLQWCIENDTFMFKIALKHKPLTRRGLLSVISSVYDPLGFLTPLILPVKHMLQQLCKEKFGWDEPIPSATSQKWIEWTSSLERLNDFSVPRCIKPKHFGKPIHAQLHHFSDASERGYGTASYLRMKDDQGKVCVSFMMGKGRLTPLKQMTIPRMELSAAVLSVRVDKMLRLELQLKLKNSAFWTDSQTVLKYIANEHARFHTFVANRVSFIQENSSLSQWRFVGTKSNPADDASRGLTVNKFVQCRRWVEGPTFLSKPEDEWPVHPTDFQSSPVDDQEVKRKVSVLSTNVQEKENDPIDRLLSYFSDWLKLKKAVAWLLKFRDALKILARQRKDIEPTKVCPQSREVALKMQAFKSTMGGQNLNIEDLERAEKVIIGISQRQTFRQELAKLEMAPPSVQRTSCIFRLDPMLDDGLLRVGGRLCRSAMPEQVKHPIILHKGHPISSLILRYIHERTGHSGRNHVLSELRKRYWITSANSAVRSIINKCVVCRRVAGRTKIQKMADLPQERLMPDLPPFTNVGMDYFGPIETKRARSLVKRYGVIFTCMSSRAVHLEMAYSLDTDSCISAIRRFICRRGQVSHIRSDNGTNLVGAEKELKKALVSLDQDKIRNSLLKDNIKWSFNPPAASHHGGVWERIIRMVRKVLLSVLHQQVLDDEGLCTILSEVEAILNNRPITTMSSDPHDLEALTPNHVLLLKSKPVLPPGIFQKSDMYLRRRWKQAQYIADLFWKRWTREYLPLLQERQKWTDTKKNIQTGDIVLIVDATAPRGSWMLGRVLQTFQDGKGLVRSVKIKTKTSVLERPITKVCLLVDGCSPDNQPSGSM